MMNHNRQAIERKLQDAVRRVKSIRPSDTLERKMEHIMALIKDLIDVATISNAR